MHVFSQIKASSRVVEPSSMTGPTRKSFPRKYSSEHYLAMMDAVKTFKINEIRRITAWLRQLGYLVKDLVIDYRDQVWAIDITFVPMRRGLMYQCAVIDVHTQFESTGATI